MLAGSGLCDDTGFSHSFCEEALSEHVVDFVGSGVVQILSFEVNFCSAEILCHFLCVVEKGRAARVIFQQVIEFLAELRIVFIIIVLFFQIDNFIHQSFRYVLASVNTKSSVRHVLSSLCIL